ncbi:MAG: molybdenum cofactor biosynthesis protein MoaE [Verrucomicrobiales bacterium]|nr:molybdenum cofactor biosynthesis protein MoaE [Verrucomicrobiales bacterium]
MERSLTLSSDPIREADLVSAAASSERMGAVIRFSGVVRGEEDGAPIRGIDYEAFVPMVERQFGILFDELETRWPQVGSVRLVHRLGFVAAGEASLWVEVTAPHRGEAFAACQWLIDRMKQVVPIWKRPK